MMRSERDALAPRVTPGGPIRLILLARPAKKVPWKPDSAVLVVFFPRDWVCTRSLSESNRSRFRL